MAIILLAKRCQKNTNIRHRIPKRKRHLSIDSDEPENRTTEGGLSLSDVPKIVRQRDGSQLSEILHMSNLHIGNAIQQLFGVEETESGVRILNIAVGECKQKSPH